MNTKNKICITKYDYTRLILLGIVLAVHETNLKDLLGEIERAQKVDSYTIGSNYITMNSIFELKKMNELDFQQFRLVFPEDADIDKDKISVLAPIGTAVLGYKVGDVIKWKVPDGENFFQITNILYQPEANGDYDL